MELELEALSAARTAVAKSASKAAERAAQRQEADSRGLGKNTVQN